MESHLVTEAARALARRRTLRATSINLLGTLPMLGGLVWAFLQPYRLTLLHPHGQGFWWLVIEPPLLVVFAGVVFAVFVARPLLADLEDHAAP